MFPSLNLGLSLSKCQRKYYKDKHWTWFVSLTVGCCYFASYSISHLHFAHKRMKKKGNPIKFSILIRFVFLRIYTIHSMKCFALSLILPYAMRCDTMCMFISGFISFWNLHAKFYVQNRIFAAQLQSKWTTSGSAEYQNEQKPFHCTFFSSHFFIYIQNAYRVPFQATLFFVLFSFFRNNPHWYSHC